MNIKTTGDVAVPNGPFAGAAPRQSEIRPLLDRNGLAVTRDSEVVQHWGVHHRTRYVLDVFPPSEGWAIQVAAEQGMFNVPDPETWVTNDAGDRTMALQPTVLFTARLVNPTGTVIASASALKVINGVSAWEQGETRARARLYEAIGLSTTNDVSDAGVADASSPPETLPPKPGIAEAAVPLKTRKGKAGRTHALAPEAQALLDAVDAQSNGELETAPQKAQEGPAQAVQEHQSEQQMEPPRAAAPMSPESQEVPAPATPETPVSPNLLRQVEHRAKLQGVPVPTFTSNEEVRAFLKDLLGRGSA